MRWFLALHPTGGRASKAQNGSPNLTNCVPALLNQATIDHKINEVNVGLPHGDSEETPGGHLEMGSPQGSNHWPPTAHTTEARQQDTEMRYGEAVG